MKKEFNLIKKQRILIHKIVNAVSKSDDAITGKLLWQIIENDKEFIKILKEEFRLYRTNQYKQLFLSNKDKEFIKKIDNLTGDLK